MFAPSHEFCIYRNTWTKDPIRTLDQCFSSVSLKHQLFLSLYCSFPCIWSAFSRCVRNASQTTRRGIERTLDLSFFPPQFTTERVTRNKSYRASEWNHDLISAFSQWSVTANIFRIFYRAQDMGKLCGPFDIEIGKVSSVKKKVKISHFPGNMEDFL